MKAAAIDNINLIIYEERKLHELRLRVNKFALREEKRLLAMGYDKNLVEGAIWDFMKSFGGEFLKGYKNQFARWLIANLGLNPNSFIAKSIGNLIEETPISEIWGWVKGEGGGCQVFGAKLADAIFETLEEDLILNPLMAQLGFKNLSVGSIGGTFREQFQTWLKSTELRQDLIDMVTDTACEFKMSSILGVGSGWNRKEKPDEATDDPNKKAKKETEASRKADDLMQRFKASANVQDVIGIQEPGILNKIKIPFIDT